MENNTKTPSQAGQPAGCALSTGSLVDLISRDDAAVSSLAEFLYESEEVSIIGDGCSSRSRDTWILRTIIGQWIKANVPVRREPSPTEILTNK